MKWMITGIQGFIGGSLGGYLFRVGDQVLGIDRKSSSNAQWKGEYLSLDAGVDTLDRVIQDFNPDVIFHGIGTASVKNSFEHPMGDFRASTLTWLNLLESVRRSEKRPIIIFPSSAALYGDQGDQAIQESAIPRPRSPYGYHKWCCEVIAEEYAQIFNQRIILLRLFSLFGFNQRRLLVWELYQQIKNQMKEVRLYGTGEEFRDFLGIEDFSKGVRDLAKTYKFENKPFVSKYNIARGESIRLRELVDLMIRITGSSKKVVYEGNISQGDPQRWIASQELLRERLGEWNPMSLEEALRKSFQEWDQQELKE